MNSYGLSTSRNIASTTSPKSFFKTSRRQIVFSRPFAYLKLHFRYFVQITVFNPQYVENAFYWPFDITKPPHRPHQIRILRRSEDRLWFLWSIRLLKTSPKRFHASRFFRCWKCRIWFRISFRHLQTSLHPLHQSQFLKRTEGRLSSQGHSPT
jgi:hypothetical protein